MSSFPRAVALALLCVAGPARAHAVLQPPPASDTAPSVALDEGPSDGLQSPKLLVRLGGLVQLDWVVRRESSEDELDPSTGAALNRDSFVLRQARLAAGLELEPFFGQLELEANTLRGPVVAPYRAQVGVGWPPLLEAERSASPAPARSTLAPWLRARLGLMSIPFGYDARERVEVRPVLERTTVVRALFPGQRDLGLALDVGYGVLVATVALMNGAPFGDGDGQSSGIDFAASKDVVGRLGVDTSVTRWARLGLGFSALGGRGLHPGNAPTKDRLAFNDGNENGLVEVSELTLIPGAPSTPSEAFSRFALGADARLSIDVPGLGWLVLRGELIRAKNLDRGLEPADPVASGRPLRELGLALGASQRVGSWLEVAAQYDVYDPDDDARRQRGVTLVPTDPSYTTLALAIAVRHQGARLLAEYDRRTNALGRSLGGQPTTLADDAFVLRAELGF